MSNEMTLFKDLLPWDTGSTFPLLLTKRSADQTSHVCSVSIYRTERAVSGQSQMG